MVFGSLRFERQIELGKKYRNIFWRIEPHVRPIVTDRHCRMGNLFGDREILNKQPSFIWARMEHIRVIIDRSPHHIERNCTDRTVHHFANILIEIDKIRPVKSVFKIQLVFYSHRIELFRQGTTQIQKSLVSANQFN